MSGDVATMEAAIRKVLDERWPNRDHGGTKPPEGLRLELHPSVFRRLLQDADAWKYTTARPREYEDLLKDRFRVPVQVTPCIPVGFWRLVIITEKVLTGGVFGVQAVPQ